MGKVIMLTGAPATGKSTLRRSLIGAIEGLIGFDYGQLLLEQKGKAGSSLSYENLRERSSEVITPSDVAKLDDIVIEQITQLRKTSHILLDSHAVTRETYGFRAITYSGQQLANLKLDVVLMLRCDPKVVLERMSKDRGGRQHVTVELAQEHQQLQGAVGISYAIACSCPFFVLDTSQLSEEDVFNQSISLLNTVLA